MPARESTPLSERQRMMVKDAAVEVRLGFIRKVYGILSVQLLLTTSIAAPICAMGNDWVQANQWMLIVSSVLLLGTMCSMCCCGRQLRQYPTNYIFLFVLTVAMAVLVGFTSALYTWQSVVLSAGITVGIFLMMTVYAWNTTTDFTGMGPYLAGALFTMLMFGFVLSIMGFCGVRIDWLVMLYDILGVLLFTFYIVFDTQRILGEYGGHQYMMSVDDYVFASLQLYLDIVNLFLHILQIFGKRR
eukprot:TRINITY_DN66292_c0_g1_i1.p1 TRINITY_DN66292_c0_g1~~TRINITY_DN66292_c0_g1_i1.p1  ORF type:complete len:266 (+),score=33.11 TRINITY_DN66292_c0_g1_i1:67-798(+)